MSVSNISPSQTLPGTDEADHTENADNVDRIREILFGNQMRDYDIKFSRLEERVAKDANELREDVKRRLASLDSYVKGELNAAAERARVESEEKMQAITALESELKDYIKVWEKKNHQVEGQNEKAHHELREQILKEANRLGEEILQKTKDLAAVLGRESTQLRATLASRQEMAEVFAQSALYFRGETSDKREK